MKKLKQKLFFRNIFIYNVIISFIFSAKFNKLFPSRTLNSYDNIVLFFYHVKTSLICINKLNAYLIYKLCENLVERLIYLLPLIDMHRYALICIIKKNKMDNTKEIIFNVITITNQNPLSENAKIIAIGIKYEEGIRILMEETEEELLKKFWNYPIFQGYFKLVGFGCFKLDLPYLITRTFKYGIRMPDLRGKVIDLKPILLFNNNNSYVTLNDYAKLFLGDKFIKKNLNGNLTELYEKGKWNEVEEYCGNNVFIINKMFQRLKMMGVL